MPDSRQSVKVIDAGIIQRIEDYYKHTGAFVQVAFFRKISDKLTDNAVVYHNFNELIQLIKETDLLIGGDSLPVHLAQLLGKPHYILYPAMKTRDFFTPLH